MPSFTTAHLPIPKNWEEFEVIVADVLSKLLDDPFLSRNGRNGQKQNGIDIVGKNQRKEYVGAQCRNTKVSIQDVEQEMKKAESFKPALSEFIFLTTSNHDAKLQEAVRLLDETHAKRGFSIRLQFWEDICNILAGHSDLMEKHFPQFVERAASFEAIYTKLMNSSVDDWENDDTNSRHVFKKDTNLILSRNDKEELDFNEPWLKRFPDSSGKKTVYTLYYNKSPIKEYFLIVVDGGRCCIPLPSLKLHTITKEEYKIGELVNCIFRQDWIYGFDRMLAQAGIQVIN